MIAACGGRGRTTRGLEFIAENSERPRNRLLEWGVKRCGATEE